MNKLQRKMSSHHDPEEIEEVKKEKTEQSNDNSLSANEFKLLTKVLVDNPIEAKLLLEDLDLAKIQNLLKETISVILNKKA